VQKKLLLLTSVISLILLSALLFYLLNEQTRIGNAKETMADEIKKEQIDRKIEDFTEKWFRFAEEIKVADDNSDFSVFVSFMPEVGSLPIKQEIFQNVAYHALQISYFFPEVNYFSYHVLWDVWDSDQEDFHQQVVITLAINEDAIKDLEKNYYNAIIAQKAGFEPEFNKAFTSVIETDVAKDWLNIVQ